MSSVDGLFDLVLASALPFVTWRVLVTDDLPKAVVLFVAVGFLAALAWTRLGAPDVALVEAAVGAGLTGALLMDAIGWMGPASSRSPPRTRLERLLFLGFAIALVWPIATWTLSLPTTSPGLTQEVMRELGDTGVSHPVTAVLLAYRGYDTLLEIIVLLAAALGVQAQTQRRHLPRRENLGPLLPALVELLLPGMVLVAGYLLWRGAHAPGGAFQSGAILAGGIVLLTLSRTMSPLSLSSALVRSLAVLGPAVFVALGLWPVLSGDALLEFPSRIAGTLILVIESALTVNIAVMLALFLPTHAGRA